MFKEIEDIIYLRARNSKSKSATSRREIDIVANLGCSPNSSTVQEQFVQWKRPPHGWFKLNTDGHLTNNTSYGGLVRDDNAEVVLTFHKSCNIEHIYMVELKGVLAGLSHLREKLGQHTQVWLEMNSKQCVNWISKVGDPPWKALGTLSHIWSIITGFTAF